MCSVDLARQVGSTVPWGWDHGAARPGEREGHVAQPPAWMVELGGEEMLTATREWTGSRMVPI